MPFWKRKPKEPGPPLHGPDFSGVDSHDKAFHASRPEDAHGKWTFGKRAA